jgi:2-methylcitrate dehydratase PrpD
MGLDGLGLRAAMGLAGSQAAGTFAHWLTPTVKFQQARGGLGGLLAAELAATGFRTSEEIFTTPDGGLFHTHSDGGHPERLLAELGSRWELEQITLRRWPAAAGNQAVVESVLDLIEAHGVRPSDVATVRVGLSATGHRLFGDVGWEDPFRALLSTRYVTSATLHDGRCWLEQFDPARLVDADVDGFARDRVAVHVDDAIEGAGATVDVVLHDGRTVSARHDIAKGDPARPLSGADLEAKFRDATTDLFEPAAADRLLTSLLELEGQPSARQLIERMRIPAKEALA